MSEAGNRNRGSSIPSRRISLHRNRIGLRDELRGGEEQPRAPLTDRSAGRIETGHVHLQYTPLQGCGDDLLALAVRLLED
jgi:hypothetical protein